MPRKFRAFASLMLATSLALAGTLVASSSPSLGASACTNPAVSSMRPTGDGRVEIVIKNGSSSTASPKASVALTYIDEDGKQTKGPAFSIASIKPNGSITLHAAWPSSAETIHTQITCPASP